MPIAERLTKARVRVRTALSTTNRRPAKLADPALPAPHPGAAPLVLHKRSGGAPLFIAQGMVGVSITGAVDKDMGMDIDKPRVHQPILGADCLARVRLAQ